MLSFSGFLRLALTLFRLKPLLLCREKLAEARISTIFLSFPLPCLCNQSPQLSLPLSIHGSFREEEKVRAR